MQKNEMKHLLIWIKVQEISYWISLIQKYPHLNLSTLFSSIFDKVMLEISRKNEDIFVTRTSQGTKIPIFEDDRNERSNFAKALIGKLHNFSFEKVFEEKYDFFSTIFEYLIKDYNTNGGGKYAEYYTPHSIASIMAKLLVGNEKDLKSMNILHC
ncbi:N-6 DNA methylase [Mycoplasmopsis canis]|uniref:N-6 DNA methylase n=1 Tax=Mycoplasmopsis canis TaxID=29555 RepID=UPI0026B6FA69|nr:N-6 DNA methylase [Mycoplasmopsis canis]